MHLFTHSSSMNVSVMTWVRFRVIDVRRLS